MWNISLKFDKYSGCFNIGYPHDHQEEVLILEITHEIEKCLKNLNQILRSRKKT